MSSNNMNINLVPGVGAETIKKEKSIRKIRNVAFVFIALLAVCSLTVFVLTKQLPLAQVQNEKGAALQSFYNDHQKIVQLSFIQDRLNNIKNLLAQRQKQNLSSLTSLITAQFPQGVTVTEFSINSGQVSITVSASSLSLISQSINNFVNLINTKHILSNPQIVSVSLDGSTGIYGLQLQGNVL